MTQKDLTVSMRELDRFKIIQASSLSKVTGATVHQIGVRLVLLAGEDRKG
jgi:hypothetical protein